MKLTKTEKDFLIFAIERANKLIRKVRDEDAD